MTDEFQAKFLDFQIVFVSRSNMKSNLVTGSATAFASFNHQEPQALQDDFLGGKHNLLVNGEPRAHPMRLIYLPAFNSCCSNFSWNLLKLWLENSFPDVESFSLLLNAKLQKKKTTCSQRKIKNNNPNNHDFIFLWAMETGFCCPRKNCSQASGAMVCWPGGVVKSPACRDLRSYDTHKKEQTKHWTVGTDVKKVIFACVPFDYIFCLFVSGGVFLLHSSMQVEIINYLSII